MSNPWTELPAAFPPVDENGDTAIKRWREQRGYDCKQAAALLGMSLATFYRYQAGTFGAAGLHKATVIVQITNGKVRYRDLIEGFKPEYA